MKTCPKCNSEMVLFFPNIPYLTAWYCVGNCGYKETATEQEIENELDKRREINKDGNEFDDNRYP